LGTSIKDWLPFDATSFLGRSPLMQKQQLKKIKIKIKNYSVAAPFSFFPK
jgi:hypothetical protein